MGLALIGLSEAATGLWALIAPRDFYDEFPAGAGSWVAALPPFNEHLVRDYGSALLGLAVLALAAAVMGGRRVLALALGVTAVAVVPHLAFHIAHAEESGAGSIVSLALNLLVPIALLVLIVRPKENR